ncbi:hypothetical protein ACRCUN_22915 [Mycobacterium sp. LTG2003]
MGRSRKRAASAPVVAIAAMLCGIGAPAAAADSTGMTMTPLQNVIRQCDFVLENFLLGYGTGTGSGEAEIGAPEAGSVRADVRLQTAHPNTVYRVRLIQTPRASVATCRPGDPGVAAGVMNTDVAGTGFVTISGPRQEGSTGAWVVVEGPPAPGKVRGDVYSTTMLVDI